MKKLSLFYLIPFLLFGGCSLFEDKVNENKIDEGEVLEIKDQELSFSIFQIVSIDLGDKTFSDGQIVGTTLEREKIDLFIQDNVLTFMVPKLNNGSYKLVFSENSKPYNIAFEVKSHELKETPAAYLESYLLRSQKQIAALEKNKSLLPEDQQASLAADIAALKQEFEKKFAEATTLTEAEKSDMAHFIQANQEWMDELSNAIAALQNLLPNGRMLFDLVVNVETRSEKISQDFLYSQQLMAKNIQKIPASTALTTYSHKGVILGSGLGKQITYMNFYNLLTSIELRIGLIYIGEGEDFNTTIGANHYFKNETPFELEVFRKYRTLYRDDANSQIPFVREFVAGYRKLLADWKNFKPTIPLALQFTPADITQNTSFTTHSLRVHSDHLTFSGITNPRVTGSSMKESSGKYYLTFKTTDAESQFKFKLTYEKQYYGKLEKTLEAKVGIKDPDEVLGGDDLSGFESFTDTRDGNVYKIVKIGTQTWFAENLRYEGNITQITSKQVWASLWDPGSSKNQPAWAYYNNDPKYDAVYGKLYNWFAVNTGTLCPQGWHIPTDPDWLVLSNFLGGAEVAGGKMKSITGWNNPNEGASNVSGFNGLPGGSRNIFGDFSLFGTAGVWWSASAWNYNNSAIGRGLSNSSIRLAAPVGIYNTTGKSCRCLKD